MTIPLRAITPRGVTTACILAVLIFLPGCIESKVPLSDARLSSVDDRLCGAWTANDGDKLVLLVCGRSETKGHPGGMMKFERIEVNASEKTYTTHHKYFFITNLDNIYYVNMLDSFFNVKDFTGDEHIADFDREGDYELSLSQDDRQISFFQYEVRQDQGRDQLTLWEPSEAVAKRAVLGGWVGGTASNDSSTVKFTASTEALVNFFRSSLGREMFTAGKPLHFSRIR